MSDMKKVGISTVYTGYNYGSALQAFAVKTICKELGYNGVVLHLGGSVIPGRDVRIQKAFTMVLRLLFSGKKAGKSAKAYADGLSKVTPKTSRELFDAFVCNFLSPVVTSWRGLKALGRQEEYAAFICGSDQIWNADALYVDPQYYLQYAPANKRIAYAPSFGRHSIAEYNRKLIGKYVKQIPYLSVREQSGVSIIQEIAGRDADCLLDPTLYFNKQDWINHLELPEKTEGRPYLLAYFLDEPSALAKACVEKIARENQWEIVVLPQQETADWFDRTEPAGPAEFVSVVANAAFVCTDSFHGTAFSLIMQVPFYTFERQYGAAGKQSARIESLLDLVNLSHRYCMAWDSLDVTVKFDSSEKILLAEKERTKNYLISALTDIQNNCGGD